MNKIEKRELVGKLKYNDTIILTYKIEYPEITYSNFRVGQNIFNKYYKEQALNLENQIENEIYNDAKNLYEYNIKNRYPIMVFEINSTYEITYNTNNIISLYIDKYEFTGGAHGTTTKTSNTWDLRLGNKLDLSYFYPKNPDYILDILKNINKQIKEQIYSGKQYFSDYCQMVLESFDTNSFYLTDNGIVIYFQQYAIAPYSSGIPVFYV